VDIGESTVYRRSLPILCSLLLSDRKQTCHVHVVYCLPDVYILQELSL